MENSLTDCKTDSFFCYCKTRLSHRRRRKISSTKARRRKLVDRANIFSVPANHTTNTETCFLRSPRRVSANWANSSGASERKPHIQSVSDVVLLMRDWHPRFILLDTLCRIDYL